MAEAMQSQMPATCLCGAVGTDADAIFRSMTEQQEERGGVLGAWREWSSATIPVPLLEELERAAQEAHISLPRFVVEVLECHAASRRLGRVVPVAPHGARVPVMPAPEDPATSPAEAEEAFPYPAETYHAEA